VAQKDYTQREVMMGERQREQSFPEPRGTHWPLIISISTALIPTPAYTVRYWNSASRHVPVYSPAFVYPARMARLSLPE